MPQCSKCGTLVISTIDVKTKDFCIQCYNKRFKKELKRYGWTIRAYYCDGIPKKYWLTLDESLEYPVDKFQLKDVGWQYRFVYLTRNEASDILKSLRYKNPNYRIVLVRIRRRVIKKKTKKIQ